MNSEHRFHSTRSRPLKIFVVSMSGMYGLHILSRMVGLYRDALTTEYIGATAEADAFFIGNWLPFCVVNVVNSAITPLIIKELAGNSAQWSKRFQQSLFSLAAIIIVPMSVILFSGRWLIQITNPSLPSENLTECYLVLIVSCIVGYVSSLNFLLAAAANSQHWFVLPRLLDTLLPVGACLGILFMFPHFGIVGISLNMLIAALASHVGYGVLIYHLGGNIWPRFPSLRDFADRITGITPYVGGCILINITYLCLIRQISFFGDGSVTILMLSDRIWNIVRGLVAAWTLVAMPRLVEAYRDRSTKDVNVLPSVLYGIGTLYVTAIGLVSIAGYAIIRFLFERGLFAAERSSYLFEFVFLYGFAACLVSAGYFTEYHMIAVGRARQTFWGGTTQLVTFLFLLYGTRLGPDVSDGLQMLKLYILASLFRLLVLIFILRDQLADDVKHGTRELLVFIGSSFLFLWVLDVLSKIALFDNQRLIDVFGSVLLWTTATVIYVALLTKARVRGIRNLMIIVFGVISKKRF